MNMIPGEKSQYHYPGQVDWIYWLDLIKWNNALVIQNKKEQVYSQLKLHFDNVYFVTVTSLVEFEKALNDGALKKTEFDLIICTDFVHQFSGHPEYIKKLLHSLALILSNDGKIVLGYHHGLKLTGLFINKLLTNNSTKSHLRISNPAWSRGPANDVFEYLRKNKFCRLYQTLYVYPSHRKPWTISNGELFAAKIHEWIRKTRRNALLLKFISSKLGRRTLNIWWPYRILIISKIIGNAQSHSI